MHAFYLNRSGQQLFCVNWSSGVDRSSRGLLLLPPLLDEVNLVRSFHAHTARLAARQGHDVLAFDLSCTGDSTGEFVDAAWSDWEADVAEACAWLAQRVDRLDVLAVQSAALHLSALLSAVEVSRVCLVQPALNGQSVLSEWLRIRVARALLEGRRETQASMKAVLERGEVVELSGYEIPAAVYQALPDVALSLDDLARAERTRIVDTGEVRLDGPSIENVRLESRWTWPLEQPNPPPELTRAVTEFLLE